MDTEPYPPPGGRWAIDTEGGHVVVSVSRPQKWLFVYDYFMKSNWYQHRRLVCIIYWHAFDRKVKK